MYCFRKCTRSKDVPPKMPARRIPMDSGTEPVPEASAAQAARKYPTITVGIPDWSRTAISVNRVRNPACPHPRTRSTRRCDANEPTGAVVQLERSAVAEQRVGGSRSFPRCWHAA